MPGLYTAISTALVLSLAVLLFRNDSVSQVFKMGEQVKRGEVYFISHGVS